MLKLVSSILLCILLVSLSDISKADFPIVDDLQVAQSLSESTGQSLVLIFGSPSCPSCVQLKQDIHDGYFLMQLDEKIVCYIDLAKHREMIKKFKISSIPDSRLIIKGKQKTVIVGYDRSSYNKWLSNAE